MKLLYIGSGFVGTCSAAVAANSGHSVLVYDVNSEKIKKLNSGDRDTIESCLFEEGLGDLLVRNMDRVRFTDHYDDVDNFFDDGEAVFMCLPTPEIGETGESDLSFYFAAAEKLANTMAKRNNGAQSKYVLVVNKSTVPINMVTKTQEILAQAGVKKFGIVANPEFLVEGKAVQGSMKPDRVVVGAENEKDFEIMRAVYQRFYDSPAVKYIEVNPREAAAGKLLANFMLFHRLAACFDVIGRTCEAFDNLKFENIRKILASDDRIGGWGLYNSLYAGGSCLVKDARSLSHQLQTAGQAAILVNEDYNANKRQLELFLARAEREGNIQWVDKTVAVVGLAFKRDTNDIRNAPAIDIVEFLQEQRAAKINLYDPTAMPNFKNMFPESEMIVYHRHEFDAVKNADVIILAADWPQFRGLADSIMAELKTRPLIMDGRRILQHRYGDLQKAGFDIISVGSPFLEGAK